MGMVEGRKKGVGIVEGTGMRERWEEDKDCCCFNASATALCLNDIRL